MGTHSVLKSISMISYKFYSRNQNYASSYKNKIGICSRSLPSIQDINISITVFMTNTICKVGPSKFPEDKSGICYHTTNKL